MTFVVGDVVTLNSGGGPMSVVAVNDDLVTCAWCEPMPEGGWKGVHRATLPAACLLVYQGDADRSQGEPSTTLAS